MVKLKKYVGLLAMLWFSTTTIADYDNYEAPKNKNPKPWYISGTWGSYFVPKRSDVDFPSRDKHNYGFNFAAALGQEIGYGLRYEGEFGYLTKGFAGQNLTGDYGSTRYLLGNIYFDVNQRGFLSPYIGTGVGYAWVNTDFNLLPDSNYGTLAYQFSTGLRFNWGKRFGTELSYRYLGTTEDVRFLGRFSSHLLNLKFHVRFAGI